MNVVGPADTEGDNGSWETRYCNEQQYFSELLFNLPENIPECRL